MMASILYCLEIKGMVQIMNGLSEVFVSLPIPPSDLFLGVFFHYTENKSMFGKYSELFRSERPDEFIYNLSQFIALMRIVTIVLSDSDPSTTGIKCHFILFNFFYHNFIKTKKGEMPSLQLDSL